VISSNPVYLVRHAKAGSRSAWSGPDHERPLTKTGRRQADALRDLLADRGVTRVVSSPYVRCRQTVEPLGERLHLPVDVADELAEGTPLHEARRLMEKFSREPAVLCTHGDVIGEVLESLLDAGIVGPDIRFEKGSTWVVEYRGDRVTSAQYLAPPELTVGARARR
jgi:8-oxo-dGTP diphosphatase